MAVFGLTKKKYSKRDFKDHKIGIDSDKDLALLLFECKNNLENFDENLIEKAFAWCLNAHNNKVRKSGEPYYTHPLETARIVIKEIPLDEDSVAAALLHDVLDYSDVYSLNDIRSEFGTHIADIVDGIAKIQHIESQSLKQDHQMSNYQKLLLSLYKDIRIILIKLADRLHNMRTLEYLPKERQKTYSQETLDIYAIFANRIGLANIKWELEDLAFKNTNPEEFYKIKSMISLSRKEREAYIDTFSDPIKDRLKKDQILKKISLKYEITGRPKHIYSIFSKKKGRNVAYENMNDLFAVRIIIDSDDPNICFYFYGIVCELYKPIPNTFKNYIYLPKQNGYQSLHTAVIGPGNKKVEVQVRTKKMHEYSEKGVAAHFNYKASENIDASINEDQSIQKWLDTVKDIFENPEDETPRQILENIERNLFNEGIYVMTPKLEIHYLPKDSTTVDFAFKIHQDFGLHCIGAKVNDKLVPIEYRLSNGDIVHVLKSDNHFPKEDWLDFVVTNKAKREIKTFLKSRKKNLTEIGIRNWDEVIKRNKLNLDTSKLSELVKKMQFKNIDDFFEAIGSGDFDIEKSLDYILFKYNENEETKVRSNYSDDKISQQVSDISNYHLEYADCCYPIPNDKILAYRTNGSLLVHRKDCPLIIDKLRKSNQFIIDLNWNSIKDDLFTTEIVVISDDTPDIMRLLTNVLIEDGNSSIRGISYDRNETGIDIIMTIDVKNEDHLQKIFDDIFKINGVKKIRRKELPTKSTSLH